MKSNAVLLHHCLSNESCKGSKVDLSKILDERWIIYLSHGTWEKHLTQYSTGKMKVATDPNLKQTEVPYAQCVFNAVFLFENLLAHI